MPSVNHIGLFPFCFDPENIYFKDELLNIAVPMWWRVKRWELNHARQIRGNTAPPEEYTENYTDILDVTDTLYAIENNIAIETELDFVCKDNNWGLNGSHFWGVSGGADSAIALGPNLYLAIDADDMVGADTVATDNPKAGEITLTSPILGWNYDIELYYQSVPQFGSLYDLLGVSGTLEPIEWWEYDPNDGGGPIYDSSTGERIRFDV